MTLCAGTRDVAISFCASAQYSFTAGITGNCPTTTGRGSLAHPNAANPRARQATLRKLSFAEPRMMVFMGAIPLVEKMRGRPQATELRIAGHSGVTSHAESRAQFS